MSNPIQAVIPALLVSKGNIVHISRFQFFIYFWSASNKIIEHDWSGFNILSVTGLRAFPGVVSYNMSKAALDMLTRNYKIYRWWCIRGGLFRPNHKHATKIGMARWWQWLWKLCRGYRCLCLSLRNRMMIMMGIQFKMSLMKMGKSFFCRTAALELADRGVRVNAVSHWVFIVKYWCSWVNAI